MGSFNTHPLLIYVDGLICAFSSPWRDNLFSDGGVWPTHLCQRRESPYSFLARRWWLMRFACSTILGDLIPVTSRRSTRGLVFEPAAVLQIFHVFPFRFQLLRHFRVFTFSWQFSRFSRVFTIFNVSKKDFFSGCWVCIWIETCPRSTFKFKGCERWRHCW